MSVDFSVTAEELRILGCLMEKAVTTPDQYPLTLNALTNACNQKSSRDPVMHLDQGTVERACRQLEEKALISSGEGKSHVQKFTQRLCNTLLSELQLNEPEYAVMTLLMLRGPQTPGELRSRSGRLYSFDDNEEVKTALQTLMDRDGGAVVARLARKSGRKDHEYMHLFLGDVDSVAEDQTIAERSSVAAHKQDRIASLETRLIRLENALADLATRLGEEIDLSDNGGGDPDPERISID